MPRLNRAKSAVSDPNHSVFEWSEFDDRTLIGGFQREKQQQLLVEPLYSSQSLELETPFIAATGVGIFYDQKQDPLMPDAFLSLGVRTPYYWKQKQHRYYSVREFGKVPDVCIEIVSNTVGQELTSKKDNYARIGVPYYAVYDPLRQLQGKKELDGELLKVWRLTEGKYIALSEPFCLETVGLGLALWKRKIYEQLVIWLRWYDEDGYIVHTAAEELQEARHLLQWERERADQERSRADQAEDELRQLRARLEGRGIDPKDPSKFLDSKN